VAVIKSQNIRFAIMNIPYRVIKRLAFVTGFCIVSCTTALAQQQSLFIFLQTDNHQPFFVQMGDKVYSSSAIGHLVISGLQDNVCNFEVGFPQQAARPQRFSIPMRNKDHGFQLVKSGNRDLTLFDWQNQETIKPLKGSGTSTLLYGERKNDDAFATLMAAVVNDSAVLYTSIVKKDMETVPEVAGKTEPNPEPNKPVAKAEEKPPVIAQPVDTVRTEKKVETIAVASQPPAGTDTSKLIKNEPVRDTPIIAKADDRPVAKDTPLVTKYDPKETPLSGKKPPVKQNIAKIQEQTKDGETKLVFVDSSESPAEVVTVYIAEDKPAVQSKTPVQTPPAPPAETNTAANPVKPETSPETSKKDSAKAVTAAPPKQDPIEMVKKVAPVKKEVAKTEETATQPKQDAIETVKKEEKPVAPAAPLSKDEIAEKIKQETWKQAPEKKSADTLTIILESAQMKKDAAGQSKAEAPKPLNQIEPVKPAAVDTPTIRLDTPPKQDMAEVTKPQSGKPATDDKPAGKTEPVNVPLAEPSKKAETEPVIAKKDEEVDAAKKPAPRAVYEPKPPADSVKKTIAAPVATKKDTVATAAKTEPEKKVASSSTLVMINSDCARIASDNDVDKLRVKMLAENDWQKRVGIANKSFKIMCLYAKHIKALTELFPTDETKYKFLEMAYPFAADTANFKQLYEVFSEESYQTKFKTLVRLQ
jgi:hypothetical protein